MVVNPRTGPSRISPHHMRGNLYVALRRPILHLISKENGRLSPYGAKATPSTAQLVSRIKGDKNNLCYGFSGDPKRNKGDFEAELKEKGWVLDDSIEGVYLRVQIIPGVHNGYPIQQISNIEDAASFDDDQKNLDVPKGITCIFSANRKSNYADLSYRWRHRNQKAPEN